MCMCVYTYTIYIYVIKMKLNVSKSKKILYNVINPIKWNHNCKINVKKKRENMKCLYVL